MTDWLSRLRDGEEQALDRLIPLLYDDLRQLARSHLRSERSAHTLNPTALVNEAYLRLSRQEKLTPENRAHFFLVAGRTMRRVLVDYARAKKRIKRGSGQAPVSLEDADIALDEQGADEILALDTAIEKLSHLSERAALMVQYRFFAGLTLAETAEVLGVTVKTIQRDWLLARAWLRKEIAQDMGETDGDVEDEVAASPTSQPDGERPRPRAEDQRRADDQVDGRAGS